MSKVTKLQKQRQREYIARHRYRAMRRAKSRRGMRFCSPTKKLRMVKKFHQNNPEYNWRRKQ
jgi:hypothetical protein